MRIRPKVMVVSCVGGHDTFATDFKAEAEAEQSGNRGRSGNPVEIDQIGYVIVMESSPLGSK